MNLRGEVKFLTGSHSLRTLLFEAEPIRCNSGADGHSPDGRRKTCVPAFLRPQFFLRVFLFVGIFLKGWNEK